MFKEREESIEEIQAMATTLDELIDDINPILKKAIEEKARLAGYHQALEQVFNLVSAKMKHMKKQVIEKQEVIEAQPVKLEVPKTENIINKIKTATDAAKEINEKIVDKGNGQDISNKEKVNEEPVKVAPVKQPVKDYSGMIPL